MKKVKEASKDKEDREYNWEFEGSFLKLHYATIDFFGLEIGAVLQLIIEKEHFLYRKSIEIERGFFPFPIDTIDRKLGIKKSRALRILEFLKNYELIQTKTIGFGKNRKLHIKIDHSKYKKILKEYALEGKITDFT